MQKKAKHVLALAIIAALSACANQKITIPNPVEVVTGSAGNNAPAAVSSAEQEATWYANVTCLSSSSAPDDLGGRLTAVFMGKGDKQGVLVGKASFAYAGERDTRDYMFRAEASPSVVGMRFWFTKALNQPKRIAFIHDINGWSAMSDHPKNPSRLFGFYELQSCGGVLYLARKPVAGTSPYTPQTLSGAVLRDFRNPDGEYTRVSPAYQGGMLAVQEGELGGGMYFQVAEDDSRTAYMIVYSRVAKANEVKVLDVRRLDGLSFTSKSVYPNFNMQQNLRPPSQESRCKGEFIIDGKTQGRVVGILPQYDKYDIARPLSNRYLTWSPQKVASNALWLVDASGKIRPVAQPKSKLQYHMNSCSEHFFPG